MDRLTVLLGWNIAPLRDRGGLGKWDAILIGLLEALPMEFRNGWCRSRAAVRHVEAQVLSEDPRSGPSGARCNTSSATDAANRQRTSAAGGRKGGNAFPGGSPAVPGKLGLLMPEVWRTVGTGGRRSDAGLPQHRYIADNCRTGNALPKGGALLP